MLSRNTCAPLYQSVDAMSLHDTSIMLAFPFQYPFIVCSAIDSKLPSYTRRLVQRLAHIP